jgi:hypothetical protein
MKEPSDDPNGNPRTGSQTLPRSLRAAEPRCAQDRSTTANDATASDATASDATASDGRIGRRAAQAARLLGAARALKPAVKVTLPEIQAAIRARRYTAMYSTARLAAVFAVVLCPMLALASAAVSRGWWALRAAPPAATVISVPAGASTRIGRRGRFDLSLTGPTTVEIAVGEGPVRLEAGQLVLSNLAGPIEILTPGHRVEIASAATVSVGIGTAGRLQVASVAGRAPLVDGVPAPGPAVAADARRAPPTAPSSLIATAPLTRIAMAPPPPTTSRPPPPIAIAPSRAGLPAAGIAPAHPAATEPTTTTPAPIASAPHRSPAADEVGIVHDALERLRGAQDAAAALRLLDEYDRRFPDGMLRDEADVTRVESLLALGRTADALERLEAMAPALLDHSPRLRVARGELRAARGHCRDALADFAAAAAAGAGGEIARRIEHGRAVCNSAPPRHTGEGRGDR